MTGPPTAGGGAPRAHSRRGAKPILDGRRPPGESALVYSFTIVPMLALVAFERLGWARQVRWPTPARLARLDAAVRAA